MINPSPSVTAQILAAMAEQPDGMTAKQLAALTGWTPTKASMCLGRLFFMSVLERHTLSGSARQNNEYTYTIRVVPVRPLRLVTSTVRFAALASEADRLADMEAV